VPVRLVKWIKQGIFVEMSEVLPDHLCSADANMEDLGTKKKKRSKVDNIIDWIQCFSIYIAILSLSAPYRVPDLLGYQSLIISAFIHHCAGRWVVYNWRFRLKASAKNIKWSAIEVTTWNMVFPDYTLGTYQPRQSQLPIPTNSYKPTLHPSQQICLKWNENPEGCSCPSCHICYRCIHFPHVADKNHKATEYPRKERREATQQSKEGTSINERTVSNPCIAG